MLYELEIRFFPGTWAAMYGYILPVNTPFEFATARALLYVVSLQAYMVMKLNWFDDPCNDNVERRLTDVWLLARC